MPLIGEPDVRPPYSSVNRKQITVIGSSAEDEKEMQIAEEIGFLLATHQAILLSGGRCGVMEASCRGAQRGGGLVVGITPGEEGNQFLSVMIKTRMNHARNFILVGSSDAVIAIGGEYGTLSEIAIALKMNIPVFGVQTWDIPGIMPCSSADEAVTRAISVPSS